MAASTGVVNNPLVPVGTIKNGSYLVITPSEGMSVLTAWSAEKITAKITGMILGIENEEEIIKICSKYDLLYSNIQEALKLLKNNDYEIYPI